MRDVLYVLIPVLTFCGLIVLSEVLKYRKRMRAWGAIARKYGMRLTGYFINSALSYMEGTFEGRPCLVYTQTRGNYWFIPSLSHLVGRVDVTLSPRMSPPFSLAPASLFDKLATRLGHGDVEIGDQEFDEAFTLTHLDPATAGLLRDPEVRRHCFLLARESSKDFRIQDGKVQVRRWIFTREEEFEPLMRPVMDFCQAVENAARRLEGAASARG